MTRPSLPRHREDSWQGSFLLNPARPVRGISVGGGRVMAGGDALYLLPRGAQQVTTRELPPDLALVAIAVEPWPPFRYALAGRRVIAVFSPDAPGDPIVEVSFATPEDDATHLAWTRHNGQVMIYFRGRNGRIGRIRIDEEGCEHLEAPPIAAIASDAAGVMAMISIVDDDADIWVKKRVLN
ncbi:MAG: hypothetical protein WCI05_11635 [Myxococcales bacterium]